MDFLCFQASSSSTSISHQPKGSSGTDNSADLTSGSDTEAAPTTLDQTLSPQMPIKSENNTIAPPTEEQTKTLEDVPKDLPADSLSETKPTGQIPTDNEDLPTVAEVSSSGETRLSEEMALDSTSVLRQGANTILVTQEINPVPSEGSSPQETDVKITEPPSAVGVTTDVEDPTASVNPGGAVSTGESVPSDSA